MPRSILIVSCNKPRGEMLASTLRRFMPDISSIECIDPGRAAWPTTAARDILLDGDDEACLEFIGNNKKSLQSHAEVSCIALLEHHNREKEHQLYKAGIDCIGIGANEGMVIAAESVLDTTQCHGTRRTVIALGPDNLRELDVIFSVIGSVTAMTPINGHDKRLYTVLTELYNNIIEHGILKLNSGWKRDGDGFDNYYRARTTGLNSLEAASIVFDVRFNPAVPGELTIEIRDSTPGFDFRANLAPDTAEQKLHGRGMALIQQLCTQVNYIGPGNRVAIRFAIRGE